LAEKYGLIQKLMIGLYNYVSRLHAFIESTGAFHLATLTGLMN
jgi:hypothetical protein